MTFQRISTIGREYGKFAMNLTPKLKWRTYLKILFDGLIDHVDLDRPGSPGDALRENHSFMKSKTHRGQVQWFSFGLGALREIILIWLRAKPSLGILRFPEPPA